MKKYVMLALAAAAVVAAPAYTALQARAAEDHAAVEATTTTEVTTDTAVVETKELTLKDGTKVHVKGEEVFVVGADGTETPAPDGTWEVNDGTSVTTVGGKVSVAAEAAPAAEEAPAAH